MRGTSMRKLVTISISIHKRLTTLPQTLLSVASQDYSHIELIVSDNGQNKNKVKEIVEHMVSTSVPVWANPSTVTISPHYYNQLIEAATGEYCVVLDDDDTLISDFVTGRHS